MHKQTSTEADPGEGHGGPSHSHWERQKQCSGAKCPKMHYFLSLILHERKPPLPYMGLHLPRPYTFLI